jgi:hypothetical protein
MQIPALPVIIAGTVTLLVGALVPPSVTGTAGHLIR